MSEKAKISIDINRKWCKACGICAGFCPKGVYGRDEFGYPLVERPEACIACRMCELRCPDFAVRVRREQ